MVICEKFEWLRFEIFVFQNSEQSSMLSCCEVVYDCSNSRIFQFHNIGVKQGHNLDKLSLEEALSFLKLNGVILKIPLGLTYD